MNSVFTSLLQTPIGMIRIEADEESVLSVLFTDALETTKQFDHENEITNLCKVQLSEYFDSKRNEFDLPLQFNGTEFQNKVWKELQTIQIGKTISYLQLAKNLGDPKCIRAAGTANGKNPFAIVVPCHRVVGTNGKLVGYAGGLWRKQWLLEHEGKVVNGLGLLFN